MPDGATLSVIDLDGTLWHASFADLLAGETVEEASQWSAFAGAGVFVPLAHVANSDGSLVATGARGGEAVKIWDTTDGTQVASLDPSLTDGIPQVFFHPDEPYVTLLSDGGILLTFTLDTDELIEIARRGSRGRSPTSSARPSCTLKPVPGCVHLPELTDGNGQESLTFR